MNQHRPNTIKIEFTEGCNLRCQMCGIQGIREKAGGPYLFMSPKTAEVLASKIAAAGWNSKIEFTLRGEPLINPNAARIISIFRSKLPKTHLMVTSNALPLLRKPGVDKNLRALFKAGLNVLALDAYEKSKKAIDQVWDWSYNDIEPTGYGYGRNDGPSPYAKVSVKVRRLIIIKDFESAVMEGTKVGTKIGSNHCGAGLPPLEEPLKKRCARPFRELSIRYDGKVMLCCNDWRGVFKVGNLLKEDLTIEQLWNNKRFKAARRSLYHKDRSFAPCNVCDNTSFRVGLLPDSRGAKTLRKPNSTDRDALERATAGRSYTIPVLREWEEQ